MTVRTRKPTFSVIELADVGRGARWLDFAIGTFSRVVLASLVFATFALLGHIFRTLVASAKTYPLTLHTGQVYIEQRSSFLVAALITGVACIVLGRRLNRAWSWAQLPAVGAIRLTRAGMVLTHRAVLDEEVRIPWKSIKAIALDSGANHDTHRKCRRFPVPSSGSERRFLFDASRERQTDFALVASRPTAPNVAIILNQPVTLSNPNADLTRAMFADGGDIVVARPPEENSVTAGLFLRTSDLEKTRSLLLPSDKLRALRRDDLH